MTVFRCANCGAVLTGELVEVPMPDAAPTLDEAGQAAPRMAPGRFTVDPLPFGPPYVATADDPRMLVSDGPRATIVLHPADARGLDRHPDRRRLNGCCRLDGLDGPNLVCLRCGAEIATEQSDCWVSWHDIRLTPVAVVASDEPAG